MGDFVKWLRADWDRALGFGLIATGALLVIFGYFGASDSAYVDQGISYLISGGIGGLFLLGIGATMLISADLHDEWRKLDRVEDVLRNADELRLAGLDSRPAAGDRNGSDHGRARQTIPADSAGRQPNLMAVVPTPPAAFPSAQGTVALALPGQRTTIFGLVVAAVVIVVGWNQAATTAGVAGGIDGAILSGAGLTLAGVVAAISTLRKKRFVQLRKSWLLAPFALTDLVEQRLASSSANLSSDAVLVADGLSRYHEAGCPAVEGLATREVERSRIPAGLNPCRLCEPA